MNPYHIYSSSTLDSRSSAYMPPGACNHAHVKHTTIHTKSYASAHHWHKRTPRLPVHLCKRNRAATIMYTFMKRQCIWMCGMASTQLVMLVRMFVRVLDDKFMCSHTLNLIFHKSSFDLETLEKKIGIGRHSCIMMISPSLPTNRIP
jgi:hypothetical protein